MKDFLTKLVSLGMCDKYKKKIIEEGAASKEELVAHSLTLDGIDFLAATNAFEPEYIKEAFSEYINGVDVKVDGKFSGRLYVGYRGNVDIDVDVVNMIGGSSSSVTLKENKAATLSVSGRSFVSVSVPKGSHLRLNLHDRSVAVLEHIEGSVLLTIYGDEGSVIYTGKTKEGSSNIRVRRKPRVTINEIG